MNMMTLGRKGLQGRPVAPGRSGIVTVLDIGTSKVACFIARIEAGKMENGQPPMRVIGMGHQVSRGLRGGTVINMDEAEEAIRATVDAAERMAGKQVKDVVISVASSELVSQTVSAGTALSGKPVSSDDVRRLLAQGRREYNPENRDILHAIPVKYCMDGHRGVRDPCGMFGENLTVDIHMVSTRQGPLRNLVLCVERCHLDIVGVAAAPYAAALSTLVEDEMDLGTVLIDMGGGTTSLAIFSEGTLVWADVIAVGGNHITRDIARGLSTSLFHAERLKTLYGSALASPSDEREVVDVPQIGESDPETANHIPRSLLTGIIQPRLEETFELVRDRLEESGFGALAGRRAVLSGGAAQLNGARELAARVLDRQVRVGEPHRLMGLAQAAGGPTFSVCAGLLSYSRLSPLKSLSAGTGAQPVQDGEGLRRMGHWLRENFIWKNF